MDRSMALKTCRSIINSLFSGNRIYTLPKLMFVPPVEGCKALVFKDARRVKHAAVGGYPSHPVLIEIQVPGREIGSRQLIGEGACV